MERCKENIQELQKKIQDIEQKYPKISSKKTPKDLKMPWVKAKVKLGILYYKEGRYPEAYTELEHLVHLKSKVFTRERCIAILLRNKIAFSEKTCPLSKTHSARSKNAEIRKSLEKLIDLRKAHPQILPEIEAEGCYTLGKIYRGGSGYGIGRSDLPQARDYFQKAQEIYKEILSSSLSCSRQKNASYKLSRAHEKGSKVLQDEESQDEAFRERELGKSVFEEGCHSCQDNSIRGKSLYYLAKLYVLEKDLSKAQVCLDKVKTLFAEMLDNPVPPNKK